MNLILEVIIILINIFIAINLILSVMNLGYVWEETHKRQKNLMDILDNFWKKFWRKIIKN